MAPKRKTDTPALAPKEEGVSRKASKLIAAPVASAAQEEVHAEAQPATSYAHYDAYLMKSVSEALLLVDTYSTPQKPACNVEFTIYHSSLVPRHGRQPIAILSWPGAPGRGKHSKLAA